MTTKALRGAPRAHPVWVLATLIATTACGLQQAGVDSARARPGSAQGVQVQGADPGNGAAPRGIEAPATASPTGPEALPGENRIQGGTAGQVPAGVAGAPRAGRPGSPGPETAGLRGELSVSVVNVTGFDQLAQIVDVNTASTGDAGQQARAVEAYVNSHGGIAGRRLRIHVRDYNAQDASEVNDNNLCQQITTVDKAFMVNLQGQIHHSARSCYKAKGTLAFEGATFGWGRSFYADHAPFLWSPSYANYDETMAALVQSARRRNWFAGQSQVGVILWDDAPYHAVVDKVVVPALTATGVKVVKATVSNADIGSIENGIHAAAQTMVANNVTHLMFVGSAPLQPFFVQQNQQYQQFVYALTSYDIPRYMAVNFARNMARAIGIGFSPVNDVLDAQYPFPQAGLEQQCRSLYEAAGVSIPGRYINDEFDSKQAISYCESILWLKRVADTISGPLTPATWTAKAEQLGHSFQTAQTFTTSFTRDKHTGPTAYRDLVYDGGCSCMTYSSGNRPFG